MTGRGRAPITTGVVGALLAAVFILSACDGVGFGAGDTVGDAELNVSRDFGREEILRVELDDVTESDTVMRVLERNAEVETRYGGGFVHGINGLAGGEVDGAPQDWLYFVNGVEADRGSADYAIQSGDRIWWDYRNWSVAMSVPAVVGQFPQPFTSIEDGQDVEVYCGPGVEAACGSVVDRLDEVGVAAGSHPGLEGLESLERPGVVVASWFDVAETPPGRMLRRGPSGSGVFAIFEGDREASLVTLDTDGERSQDLGSQAGLIAAVRPSGRGVPIWVVTGGTAEGVARGAEAIEVEALESAYALAVGLDDSRIALPTP